MSGFLFLVIACRRARDELDFAAVRCVGMRIILEDVQPPPGCLLIIGGFTLMFESRADAQKFIRFLINWGR